ncbi:MAG: diaminopimelate decarboxylase [Clostridiales bacterium]|nr:diaminopimelate decarboxylase [Clostridiales bacterium]
MELWGTMKINDKGHLEIGGCDTVSLAQRFGTPLYVMDDTQIRDACRRYVNAIQQYGNGMVLYAGKAFSNIAMCKLIQQEGLGLDVVSGGELYTAVKAGFPPERIYMHGNNKSYEELRMAVEYGVERIVIDSFHEVELLEQLAINYDKNISVSVRVKPGIDAHTHHYIKTGQQDSKFGFGIEDGQIYRIIEYILAQPHLELKGLHCHIGSQIFETDPYIETAKIMLRLMWDINDAYGLNMDEIDFGGGFGIRYVEEDNPLEPEDYINALYDGIKAYCDNNSRRYPRILIEPGRSIAGPAGITLYTVGAIKHIPDVRTYVSVDGGMADNPRPALYQAKYSAMIANKADKPAESTVSIAGKCCESGDMLIWDIGLPNVESGDILAVFDTGAYNYSMASNYNRLPIPAVVLVKDGRAELMIKRQSYDDLISHDCIPSWL